MLIPFANRSYDVGTRVSRQKLVNWYAEIQPVDAATKIALLPTPGLKVFASLNNGPVTAQIKMKGVAYAISGNHLYSINSGGVVTDLGGMSLGQDPEMAQNGTQIFIAAGTTSYIYSAATGLLQITDPDFPGAKSVDYQDGYFVFATPATGEFYVTSLYDGFNVNALDFATAEGNPDELIKIISDHRELWLFGTESTEIWYNAGTPFPFERNVYLERGCGAKGSVAKLDNSVFWLGDDLIVYRANAYQPARISDHGLEAALGDYTVEDCYSWTYAAKGHSFYGITFPTDGKTHVFDVATGTWHERESYDESQYRVRSHLWVYNKHIVGDYTTGILYQLDDDTYTDAGVEIVRQAVSPPIRSENKVSFMGMVQIEFEHGQGLTTGQGSDPQAMLQWSDDGGNTWSHEHWRSVGKIGEYEHRAIWRRLGRFRSRIFRLVVSDPVKWVVINAFAE